MARILSLRTRLALLAVLAACRSASAQAVQRRSALILEKRGSIGQLSVGTKIDSVGGELHRVRGQPGIYQSSDGALQVEADTSGSITKIRILSGNFLTTRLIRPGRSTLKDVLSSYGRPAALAVRGGELIVSYDGIEFGFPYQKPGALSEADFGQLLQVPVRAITLTRTRSKP